MEKDKITEEIEKKIVEDVIADFKNRQYERKKMETTWQLNINFLVGNQYCFINGINEIVDDMKQYFWQEKEVFNHIAPIVDLRISKLNKIRPILTVVPFSDDPNDIGCAKVSRNLLKCVSYDLNLSKIINDATLWSEICGTAFYKIGWNNLKGRVIGKNEVGQNMYEGEVDISVVSPFEIYPDNSSVENISDMRSIIHAKAYSVDAIKDMYGVDLDGCELETMDICNVPNIGGLGYSATSKSVFKYNKPNQAVVIEKYECPSVDNPNGKLTIVAGNKLIYIGELPYINTVNLERGFPFVKQCSISIPNSFWGMSIIERLIPVQRSFNAVKNRKHEFLNRLSLGVLTVEDGSVDIENLEEEGLSPGKILVYRQGSSAPKMLTGDTIPTSFEKEEEMLLDEFINISGVSDLLTSSSINTGNISGVALQLLIEQDESRITSSEDEIKRAIKEVGRHILRLYKQFAVLPHTSRLVGENGEIEMFYWNNSQINSEDVVFETENEVSQTLAQKRSMILEILNAGLFNDENGVMSNSTRQKVLEQFGFGTWNNSQDLQTLQVKQAERENYNLLKSASVSDPSDIDDHNIHITQHTAFILGNDFEKMGTEAQKQIMIEHIKKHKEILKDLGE